MPCDEGSYSVKKGIFTENVAYELQKHGIRTSPFMPCTPIVGGGGGWTGLQHVEQWLEAIFPPGIRNGSNSSTLWGQVCVCVCVCPVPLPVPFLTSTWKNLGQESGALNREERQFPSLAKQEGGVVPSRRRAHVHMRSCWKREVWGGGGGLSFHFLLEEEKVCTQINEAMCNRKASLEPLGPFWVNACIRAHASRSQALMCGSAQAPAGHCTVNRLQGLLFVPLFLLILWSC